MAGEDTCPTWLAVQYLISERIPDSVKKKFRKTKLTRKPGPTKSMKKARYIFAKQHEHWTLEGWKSVIWTETSIVLGQRWGMAAPNVRCVKSCLRERWKEYSDFMFWCSFIYDFKGPAISRRPKRKRRRQLLSRISNV